MSVRDEERCVLCGELLPEDDQTYCPECGSPQP